MAKLSVRRLNLERSAKDLERREQQEATIQATLRHLEQFCLKGLDALGFEERQQLLRLLVERITVKDGKVRIETVIPGGDDDVQLRTRRPESL